MSGWVSDYLIYNLEFFGYKNIKWNSNVKLIKLIKIVTIYNALIVVHTAYPEAKSLIIIIQTSGALSCRKEHLMPGSEKEEVGAITDLRSDQSHFQVMLWSLLRKKRSLQLMKFSMPGIQVEKHVIEAPCFKIIFLVNSSLLRFHFHNCLECT